MTSRVLLALAVSGVTVAAGGSAAAEPRLEELWRRDLGG